MKFIIVYNSNGDLKSRLRYTLTQIFSPEKCKCYLRQLTHGKFRVLPEWSKFIKKYRGVEELYIDEFENKYPGLYSYPIILKQERGRLSVLISTEEIEELKSFEELKALIKYRFDNEIQILRNRRKKQYRSKDGFRNNKKKQSGNKGDAESAARNKVRNTANKKKENTQTSKKTDDNKKPKKTEVSKTEQSQNKKWDIR